MLSHGGETPSRQELLSVVKKHSNLLGKTIVDEEDASDIEMDQGFWHDLLNLYFIEGKESRGRQDDDLVFFVKKMGLNGINSNDESNANPPYFVRRLASKLDSMVGDNVLEVDWRRSFYLNLIAHTSFTVTVAICSNKVLQNHRAGQGTPLNPVYKEAETVPAYPDICFAIDDFDSTIDAVVLSDTDHCYCVVLNAHAGAAFPKENLSHNDAQKTENDMMKSNKKSYFVVIIIDRLTKSIEGTDLYTNVARFGVRCCDLRAGSFEPEQGCNVSCLATLKAHNIYTITMLPGMECALAFETSGGIRRCKPRL
ncbi:hypothetical protein KSS87_011045 [Heliosperma pusillum]|nr:hypothetical protein KSS87_011045 [Heliosperma pusillum]